jgi:NADPH-dependent 2,4-dienoyl-CoA reductase/sulfur reductase-like enzyme/rhodanese-related sulfurtransferase
MHQIKTSVHHSNIYSISLACFLHLFNNDYSILCNDLQNIKPTIHFQSQFVIANLTVTLKVNSERGYDMKILIIGSVAAGTSAAAKARRNSEQCDITVLERGKDLSYSGCGMPYLVSGLVKKRQQLTPRDVLFFKERYNVDVRLQHQVELIKPSEKSIVVRDLSSNEAYNMLYDKLIICTGARPIIPSIPGVNLPNVVVLRSLDDLDTLLELLQDRKPQKACVAGSGFVGLEMTESLTANGIEVTLIEKSQTVLPYLDEDMAAWARLELERNGVNLIIDDEVIAAEGDETGVRQLITRKGRQIETDLVVLAVGVKPNVDLARASGIKIGSMGGILVNQYLQTSDPDILAAGDCIETISLITGEPIYRPMGSTANKTGRLAGHNCFGNQAAFNGVLGTSICKLFDMTIGITGLTEKEARQHGFNPETVHLIKPNHPEYYPGSNELVIKVIADKDSGRLLGGQVIGKEGADKRLDVLATSIYFKANVDDLFTLDLAYAPPYSTTKDPVIYAGMVLDNSLNHDRPLIRASELKSWLDEGKVNLIDVREYAQFHKGHILGAVNIPLANLRSEIDSISRELPVVVYCNSGTSGNAAQNIMINSGFKQVFNLSGGYKNWVVGMLG